MQVIFYLFLIRQRKKNYSRIQKRKNRFPKPGRSRDIYKAVDKPINCCLAQQPPKRVILSAVERSGTKSKDLRTNLTIEITESAKILRLASLAQDDTTESQCCKQPFPLQTDFSTLCRDLVSEIPAENDFCFCISLPDRERFKTLAADSFFISG